MTDYDKKYLWIFAGVEILVYLAGRLLIALLDFIPAKEGFVNTSVAILKGTVTPCLLIIGALIILGVYKNNRDGGGTI